MNNKKDERNHRRRHRQEQPGGGGGGGGEKKAGDNVEGAEGEEDEEEEVFEGIMDLSAESVMSMAQSIGAELPEDVAYSVGLLAVEKLRSITMLAVEFSKHENSPGLRVEDFRKAEEIVRCPSYGHGCVVPSSTKMIPIPSIEVAVIDEGPEVNLFKTLSCEKMSEIAVEPLDPTFFVHYANYDNELTRNEDVSGCNNYSCLNSNSNSQAVSNFERDPVESSSSKSSFVESVKKSRTINLCEDGLFSGENETEEDDEDFRDEEIETEVLKTVGRLKAEGFCLKKKSSESNNNVNDLRPLEISAKWQDYMKVVAKCFLSSSVDEEFEVGFDDYANRLKQKSRNARDFFAIVTDIQQNGALPCLNVICDFLCDYLRGQLLPVTPKGLKLAVAIIDAFICGTAKLNNLQIRKISSLLIQIVVCPAPCEVLNCLTNVFMKCLKINDDLLTWTCSYITEVLKQLTNNTFASLSADLRHVFCGAICLANGLESVSIQVAQEFGWHTSIITFLEVWSKDLQLKPRTVLGEGGFVEEEVLKFCRNFILKYHNLVTAGELKKIRDLLNDVYGEKLLIILSQTDTLSSSKRTKVQKNPCSDESLGATDQPVIRRGYWKDRKITLRYHKERQTQPVLGHSTS